jgi:hypothetical protein
LHTGKPPGSRHAGGRRGRRSGLFDGGHKVSGTRQQAGYRQCRAVHADPFCVCPCQNRQQDYQNGCPFCIIKGRPVKKTQKSACPGSRTAHLHLKRPRVLIDPYREGSILRE